MHPGNVYRLRTLMAEADLDAVVAFAPDTIRYITGYRPPGFLPMSGAYSAFFAADGTKPPALVVSDIEETWARRESGFSDVRSLRLWAEIDDRDALETGTTIARPRPVQVDWDQVLALLGDILGDRGLLKGRIGCELESLPSRFRARLERDLSTVRWTDASDVIWRAEMLKTDREIDTLRECVRLAEIGMSAVMLKADPRGKSVSQLRSQFDSAVRQAVEKDPGLAGYQSSRVYMSAGGMTGAQVGRNENLVEEGSIVWIDCAVNVDGYESDIGRTFQVGAATPVAERITHALLQGGEAGLAMLGPGVKHCALFAATEEAIHTNGLPTYTRGHFGHAIGVGGVELPPFVSQAEDLAFEPGMVLAYECPYYVRGLGAFQFEDDIVIRESGIEVLNSLPRQLFRI